jgi:RNA polymerase sigma factor (sigma-70 family)
VPSGKCVEFTEPGAVWKFPGLSNCIVTRDPERLPPGGIFLLKKYSLGKTVTAPRFSKRFMEKHLRPDTEILEALSGQDAVQRKAALRHLFEHPRLRQMTMAHVRKYGGNRQDGEDVFQEAVIVFDRKVRQGAFRAEGSLEAYFAGIVRWHWFNEQQRRNRTAVFSHENPPEPPPGGDPEVEYLLAERRHQLENLLELLSEKCRNILKMYQLDYSMEEIAGLLGFANSGVAKKEAFLCRQRFKSVLKRYPEIWQDLVKNERP